MLARVFGKLKSSSPGLLTSELFDQKTFYPALARDIRACQSELLIESPFLTRKRVSSLLPELKRLVKRKVYVTVCTKHPHEHEGFLRTEAEAAIGLLQNAGVEVLYIGGHHRKLAIIDRRVLWEGSLNILSQAESSEVMRRIVSAGMAEEMIAFAKLSKYLKVK
jgi:hypothetical protein